MVNYENICAFKMNVSKDTLLDATSIKIEEFEKEPMMSSSRLDASELVDNNLIDGCGNIDKSLSSDCIDISNEISDMTETTVDAENSTSLQLNDTSQPIVKVIFRDENVSRQYKHKVREFFYAIMHSKLPYEKNADTSSLILEIWDNKSSQDQSFMETNSNSLSLLNNHDIKSNNGLYDLFMIDTKPKLASDFDVPTYGKKYENTFEESDSETSKDALPKMSCFNCGGNHNLRDCQLPRNQANIHKNRKDFGVKYMKSGVRYHLNEEQKFSHMIPGQLSQKLRAALGLKDNELPKHIYRMRSLGYPPGWLDEVCLQPSGLSLFNSDGLAETDPNNGLQEINMDINKDRYNVKKIYDYPGFNVPPPVGTIDESYKFNALPMDPLQSKETMLLHMQGRETNDGYKRKKLKLPKPVNTSETISSCEMDIEVSEEVAVENVFSNGRFVPPLSNQLTSLPPPPPPPPPSSSPPPLPPPPPASSSSPSLPPPALSSSRTDTVMDDSGSRSQEMLSYDSTDDVSRGTSPSLPELENIKQQLLVELEETSSCSNPDASLKNNLSISEDNAQLNRSLNLRESLNASQCSIKSDLGTPILESISPYNKLPSSEKFSKNICDVLNFENLPDSTGKYEQMTGVLQKVRNTMAKINQI